MIDTIATVESNHRLSPVYGRIKLQFQTKLEFLPGQFVMVRPQGLYEPILRRALAVYKIDQTGSETAIELLYQVFGRGLEELLRVRAGDKIECLGPLGNWFDLSPARKAKPLLVAGGVGSASLLPLAQELKTQGGSPHLFFGAASKHALIGIEDFEELEIQITTSTDDGSAGFHGRVTDALVDFLDRENESNTVLYSCGPYPMMKRVAEIAAERNCSAYVSLETRMACGFGVCVGCVHPIKNVPGQGFSYQRVCVEGPVFDSAQVIW